MGTVVAATQAAVAVLQGGGSAGGDRGSGRMLDLEKSWKQNVPFPEYSLSDFIVI